MDGAEADALAEVILNGWPNLHVSQRFDEASGQWRVIINANTILRYGWEFFVYQVRNNAAEQKDLAARLERLSAADGAPLLSLESPEAVRLMERWMHYAMDRRIETGKHGVYGSSDIWGAVTNGLDQARTALLRLDERAPADDPARRPFVERLRETPPGGQS